VHARKGVGNTTRSVLLGISDISSQVDQYFVCLDSGDCFLSKYNTNTNTLLVRGKGGAEAIATAIRPIHAHLITGELVVLDRFVSGI